MKFSIIVPVHNEEENIARCIESLLGLDYWDKEIIIVNDGSTDKTSSIVAKFADRGVILINREQKGGISRASNDGLANASGDIVVRTDGDTVVYTNWLQDFAKYFEDQNVVAVGGAYRCLNSTSNIAYSSSIVDYIFSTLLKRKFLLNRLSGANRAIRTGALREIKKFDESFSDTEDIKIYLELKKIGKVIYDPEITVKTDYPTGYKELWRRHYGWGYGVGRHWRYYRGPKILIRPTFIFGFYIVMLASIFNIFFKFGIGKYFFAIFLLYLLFFFLIAVFTIKMINNRAKMTIVTTPFIFLFQNTAYCFGMLVGFLDAIGSKNKG